jgi:hypothetical protein
MGVDDTHLSNARQYQLASMEVLAEDQTFTKAKVLTLWIPDRAQLLWEPQYLAVIGVWDQEDIFVAVASIVTLS